MSMSKKQSGSTEKAFLMGPVDFPEVGKQKLLGRSRFFEGIW